MLVLGVPAGELLDMFGGATKELGGLLVESVNLVQLDMLRVKFDSSEVLSSNLMYIKPRSLITGLGCQP